MCKRAVVLIVALLILGWTPTTTTVASDWTLLCQESVGRFQTVGFKLHNTGANPLTDCVIETWVGPATTDWMSYYTWTSCTTLAAGGKTVFEVMGNSNEKFRVRAKSAAGTTVSCRPYGI